MPKLIVNCLGGLGQRVIAYLSALSVAERHGYDFRYAWPIVPLTSRRKNKDALPLAMGDLWDMKEPPMSEVDWRKDPEGEIAQLVAQGAFYLSLTEARFCDLYEVLAAVDRSRNVVIDGHGYMAQGDELSRCARTLTPFSSTAEEVEKYVTVNNFTYQHVAALQLRADARHTGYAEPVDRFMALARKLADKGQKIFLSCEVPKFVDKFKKVLGDSMLCLEKPKRVNTPKSLKVCIKEWYIMREADSYFYTKKSGYGYLGALLRGDPQAGQEI